MELEEGRQLQKESAFKAGLIASLLVLAVITGFWIGWYASPEKIVKVEKVVEVEKIVEAHTDSGTAIQIPSSLFEGKPDIIFNTELTDGEQWILYATEGVGKGAPPSGRIVRGIGEETMYSPGFRWSTNFEWLENGQFRYQRFLRCGENTNYAPEDYIPKEDPRCADVTDAYPFVLENAWIYGDVAELTFDEL